MLKNPAFELLFGGQAGGGKSVGLLADASRHLNLSDFAAILFRRTYKQLTEPGGLVQRSHELFLSQGGEYQQGDHRWRFPSGSQIVLRHLQYSSDRYAYQGAEYSWVGFDQLEQFEENDYLYLFSRARSRDPRIRARIRNSANPGPEWILRRWLPWLGNDAELSAKGWPHAKSGQVLYFKRVNDEDVLTDKKDPEALSRTFIPSSIYDNPILLKNDPGYINRLKALPYVERMRLLEGDWHVKEQGGTLFKPEWISVVTGREPAIKRVRAWDLAATASTEADFTANSLWEIDKGNLITVVDAYQDRLSPGDVSALLNTYHRTDPLDVIFAFEQEPGQAGKAQAHQLRQQFLGRPLIILPVMRDKVTRSYALSSAFEGGRVRLLEGKWNSWFILHYVNFPSPGWHDDIVDTGSLGFNVLTGRRSLEGALAV